MLKRSISHTLLGGCAAAALMSAAAAQDFPDWPGRQPLNAYGHTGLLEMPSARMMSDSEFAATFAMAPETFRTTLSFQAFPWLEGSFRYTRVNDYYEDTGDGDTAFTDRAFSFKVRIWEESAYLPAISIGIQDIGGDDLYSGEYIVASKSFGDFDVTLGLGWGRLGSAATFENPLSSISSDLGIRPTIDPNSDDGSTPVLDTIFHGRDVAVFGGVVWQTPIDGLKAIVEYSGDNYAYETGIGLYEPDSQFNFGLSYELTSFAEVSASYLYGNTFGLRFSFRFDPSTETMKAADPKPTAPSVRRVETAQATTSAVPTGREIGLRGVQLDLASDDWSVADYADDKPVAPPPASKVPGAMQSIMESGQWYDMPAIREQIVESFLKLAREQDLGIEAIDLKKDSISVYYTNKRYVRETEVIHRLMRIMTTLPPSVEHFYLTSLVSGYPSTEVHVTRTAYERAVQQFAEIDSLLEFARIQGGPTEIPDDAVRLAEDEPKFDWSISPRLRMQGLSDDQSSGLGVLVKLEGSVDFGGGWTASAAWTSDVFGDTEAQDLGPSPLPRVRSDYARYQDEGQHGIESMLIQKTGKLSNEVFYQVRAGLLEDMYAGIGGEIVWRPDDSDVSFGANLYYLKQRDYDRLFSFRDYEVLTGHASVYWQNAGWDGLNVNLHVGRYLAGDFGGTLELTRKFDSGVEIGAYATLTDVSFDDFGEGSFDKGIILRIPFGWITPFNTKMESSISLSPYVRDGGQRLYGSNPLWEALRETNESEIGRTWPLDVTPGL